MKIDDWIPAFAGMTEVGRIKTSGVIIPGKSGV
jgi:hypothetical protein